MDYADLVAAVERETGVIVEALRAAPPDARVPTCPDFALSDLAAHLGEFSALWAHVLCEAAHVEKTPYAPLTDDDDLAEWYRPLAGSLLDRLRATTGDAPAWMWIPGQEHAGAVARRCANELSIHRYDAQTASASTTPLDAAVALDAIDEIFVMLPAWGNPPDGSGSTLGLRADEGGCRTITLGPEGPSVQDEAGPADLTLTGSASDLALLLFERPPLGAVHRDGDPRVLDAWYREFRFD
jgi:uncharacterized protein (TIGR03083 family)